MGSVLKSVMIVKAKPSYQKADPMTQFLCLMTPLRPRSSWALRMLVFLFALANVQDMMACGQSPTPHYTAINLGSLLGPHQDGNVVVASMNRHGQIVGYIDYVGGTPIEVVQHAFIWQDGKATFLPLPPHFTYSVVTAQNQTGVIVGNVHNNWSTVRIRGKSKNVGGEVCACIWRDGRARLLKTGHPGDSGAMAINSAGDVVGGYSIISAHSEVDHACLWTHGGRFIDLGLVTNSKFHRRAQGWTAMGINDERQVWGRLSDDTGDEANPTLVIWQNGHARTASMEEIRHLRAVTNSHGDLLQGPWVSIGHNKTEMLWHGRPAEGRDLNDQGQVVGAMPVVGNGSAKSLTQENDEPHAFLWEAGKMFDLNDLLSLSSGWVLTEAISIDDQGRILAWGNQGPWTRPFLLEPRGG